MYFIWFFYTILSVICFQSFRGKFDSCINPFLSTKLVDRLYDYKCKIKTEWQCRPWAVWAGSTLFAEPCLSKKLSLWYFTENIFTINWCQASVVVSGWNVLKLLRHRSPLLKLKAWSLRNTLNPLKYGTELFIRLIFIFPVNCCMMSQCQASVVVSGWSVPKSLLLRSLL